MDSPQNTMKEVEKSLISQNAQFIPKKKKSVQN